MPYLLEVSGSVSSSVDISTISIGSRVLSYKVPGRIDEDYDEWYTRYNESGSVGLNSVVESGSFSTSIVESISEVSSSYFVLELENSQTIDVPHSHCHLYYYKTSENKWLWVGNHASSDISEGDYLFGSDGKPIKITTITHRYDVIKSFIIIDVEEIDNAFYGNSSDGYSILKHNGGRGGGGGPPPPQNVATSTPNTNGDTTVTVEWDAAAVEVQGAKYDIRHANNSAMSSGVHLVNGVATVGQASYSVTLNHPFTANTNYYFQVRQKSSQGNSEWAPATPVQHRTAVGTPDAPTNVTVSAKTETQLTFTFSTAGATSYNVYFGTNNPPTNIENGSSVGSYTYYSAASLTMGNSPYYFQVTATNAYGTSEKSSVLTADVLPDVGGIPASFTATPVSLDFSWTNPTGTATAYLYGGTTANSTTQLTSGNINSYTHTGLTPSDNYYYRTRVRTTNHNGFYGGYSSNMNNVGMGTTSAVSAPTNLSYAANSIQQFTISWTEPTYSTRTYIEYYFSGGWRTVNPDGGQYEGDGVTSWICTDSDTFDLNGVVYFDLTQNTAHTFRLRAYQTGVYSSYTSNLVAYTLPGPPTNVSATANSYDLITLSWTNPAGSALSETFMIEYGTTTNYGTEIETSTGASSYQVSGLDSNQTYYFRIRTRTDAGDSSTETLNATTADGPNPEFGDVLSLGGLGHATGNEDDESTSSLNVASGGTSTVSMREFFVGGVSSTLGGSSFVETGGTAELSMVFSNVGSKFMSRIAGRADQFSWSSSDDSIVGVSPGDYRVTITGNGNVNQSATITCVWDANYNETHDNISTNRTATKTVTVRPAD